jgi:uncharacterized protein YeaO (DUF488 family)
MGSRVLRQDELTYKDKKMSSIFDPLHRKAERSFRQRRIAIYTIRKQVQKYAMDYGIVVLDASVLTGLPLLRPSNQIFDTMKAKGESWEWFADQYMQQLEDSYDTRRVDWQSIINTPAIAVCCDASHDKESAHRMVLRTVLTNIAYRHDLAVTHGGEILVDIRNRVARFAA